MDIISDYVPKSYGTEYYKLKGSHQYAMFTATALGVKISFDDWINVNQYDEFVGVCKEYGLHVEPDVVFVKPNKDKFDYVGGKNITTTFFEGRRWQDRPKEGEVHVMISRSKKIAMDAKRFGWYSVIIDNRSINKPFVDHLRFGRLLGFPACCVDFFRRYNNWSIYSHPYEAYKRTTDISGKAKGSYLCNNNLMDHIFFFIHHIPCSYRCKKTIELAGKVEEKILDVEPLFAKKTAELLKKPLLVFAERNFIIFDGKKNENTINYTNSQYKNNPAREEDTIDFYNDIKKGNHLEIDGPMLKIMKNGRLIRTIPKKHTWFMIDFD